MIIPIGHISQDTAGHGYHQDSLWKEETKLQENSYLVLYSAKLWETIGNWGC